MHSIRAFIHLFGVTVYLYICVLACVPCVLCLSSPMAIGHATQKTVARTKTDAIYFIDTSIGWMDAEMRSLSRWTDHEDQDVEEKILNNNKLLRVHEKKAN